MTIEVSWGAASHTGCVRTANQDAVLAGPSLFAVADGMGGHAAGEVASAIAVARLATVAAHASGEEIIEAVRAANAQVLTEAADGSGREGMGTTLSGLALATNPEGEALFVFNVGDSRTYLLDESGLTQITTDHSVVAELVRDGQLDPAEADHHHARNVVTRALGIGGDLVVDHWWIEPEPGQTFLLCSDGLTNEVPHAVIEGVLRAAVSAQVAVDSLLGIALDAGARDNVSAVAVRIESVTVDRSPVDDDTNRRRALAASRAAVAPLDSGSVEQALIESVPGVADPSVQAPIERAPTLVTDVPSGEHVEQPLGE